ncbi:MAG: 23S rRNA (adenine(2503)-C(2))-methyltransferase RlmN [Coriobacteriales bacterium]|jgi:23S rRNA (adenine2503-C2)-methyltransferase|nr:23S rRNA (adenine(2503)-C(2))-methyltransferase RlmN [Coriobacteriales bacterium]
MTSIVPTEFGAAPADVAPAAPATPATPATSADVDDPRIGIKRYGLDGLRELLASLGEPAYRAKQLLRWLYGRGVATYDEMTDLPARLRERLHTAAPLAVPELLQVHHSQDGARKYLLRLADGARIEAVGLPSASSPTHSSDRPSTRLTVCFSTQVGCAMGCAFCATGRLGLTRQLAPGEMADQLLVVADDFGCRVTNAVAMGEGEPLANYDATLAALRLMNAPDGLGIGARHLTISTCGLLPQLRRLTLEPEQFTLAVSLHSAVQATRDMLMPALARYPLDELREALITYAQTSGRRPTLEVVLIDGINDTPEEINALAEYCRGMLVHINLIPLNAGGASDLRPASPQRLREAAHVLSNRGIEATVRRSRGADILGACGQLAAG